MRELHLTTAAPPTTRDLRQQTLGYAPLSSSVSMTKIHFFLWEDIFFSLDFTRDDRLYPD